MHGKLDVVLALASGTLLLWCHFGSRHWISFWDAQCRWGRNWRAALRRRSPVGGFAFHCLWAWSSHRHPLHPRLGSPKVIGCQDICASASTLGTAGATGDTLRPEEACNWGGLSQLGQPQFEAITRESAYYPSSKEGYNSGRTSHKSGWHDPTRGPCNQPWTRPMKSWPTFRTSTAAALGRDWKDRWGQLSWRQLAIRRGFVRWRWFPVRRGTMPCPRSSWANRRCNRRHLPRSKVRELNLYGGCACCAWGRSQTPRGT